MSAERRREKRRPIAGPVCLIPEEPLARAVNGALLDDSEHGFRATHDEPTLRPGHCVRFEHASGAGRARVVWTRIFGERIESGFLVLE